MAKFPTPKVKDVSKIKKVAPKDSNSMGVGTSEQAQMDKPIDRKKKK
jgi:hypothetical protein